MGGSRPRHQAAASLDARRVRSPCVIAASGAAGSRRRSRPGSRPLRIPGSSSPDLAAQSARLQPILRQMKPNDWLTAGAPKPVAALWNQTSQQNLASPDLPIPGPNAREAGRTHSPTGACALCSKSLSRTAPGLTQYQNPALAELIAGMQEEGKPVRDAYSQRVLDLAVAKESQFQIADHEAQRCREFLQ